MLENDLKRGLFHKEDKGFRYNDYVKKQSKNNKKNSLILVCVQHFVRGLR
jgi:hypothetical protein